MNPTEFQLDSIITVIDCINFKGYEDTSYTAKMQAQYTDLILLNKHELVSERELDLVIDSVNDLNLDTPKVKWMKGAGGVDPSLLFGIGTDLFLDSQVNDDHQKDHHEREVDLGHIIHQEPVSKEDLEAILGTISKDEVYRIKGVVCITQSQPLILNWAFGRWQWTLSTSSWNETRITLMGVDLGPAQRKLAQIFPKD